MANVTVIGAQWGDEGKGKIIDWLSNRADVVVRFQGGNNAGHTIVVGNKIYKLSLLPSGVVQGKLSIIGNGVVVDPWSLLDEIDAGRAQGLTITPDMLVLADNAVLVLPLHRELDAAREAARRRSKIGTTGRGIGPAYEDKVGRRAIRVVDLADREALQAKIERLLAHHNAAAPRASACRKSTPAALLAALERVAPKILPFAEPAWRRARRGGARPASGCCSRARRRAARRRPRHLSLSSPRPTPWPARRRRARAWGRRRSATCWASSRPTPRASAKARSPPS